MTTVINNTCTHYPMCPNVTAVNYNTPHNATSTPACKVFSEFTETPLHSSHQRGRVFVADFVCSAAVSALEETAFRVSFLTLYGYWFSNSGPFLVCKKFRVRKRVRSKAAVSPTRALSFRHPLQYNSKVAVPTARALSVQQ